MKPELQKEIFEYLEDLRDTGVVNMFGSVPYIQEVFGLEKTEAREVLTKWMESFK
jgi:hypothetical protein